MIAQLIAWHLGSLHPFEKALTFGLAFGPFVILIAVIAIRRRQDHAAEESLTVEERPVSGAAATPDLPEPPSPTL